MLTYHHLLTVLLFFPLLGALIILPLRNREQHILIRRISLVVGLIEFLLSFIPIYSIPPAPAASSSKYSFPGLPPSTLTFISASMA